MTRLTEKLRLSSLFIKPTRFLSLLSLSTLHHLCNSLTRFIFSQTLPFFSMDNNLFSDNVDYFDDDFDSSYSLRPNRRLLQQDYRDFSVEKVYLLPYRWWIDAEGEGDRAEGVLYTVCSNFDSESEILLNLKKEEDREKIKSLEVGVSGRHYALVPEGLWLRALKRKVEMNLDSQAVVQVIKKKRLNSLMGSTVVRQIWRLLEMVWEVEVTHIYREVNKGADALANIGCSLDHGILTYDVCPDQLSELYGADCLGISTP
ncbi:ubiquitin carboxyl-terminal hydrolase 8-like protein [Trifolium pratense]|uniref:Ubiquitin carboxyl-terminal hydrolase 8-like protein n=1 Tax=Trifolium pratense TaxID=57577 RepID=A0A2K3P129_TRIPR|nr:ubiquitin carboxyl-terminal hydrolase 8-like protein [Trifolium pratense]PNY08544.1 ubiquitin carboxyl-terminal hydrolase 8-like protein [Trifolium pratense]PNY08987.1 ubiquitin carboxyl-terminal hydrolase 8-like protein [Trifolium pratense]